LAALRLQRSGCCDLEYYAVLIFGGGGRETARRPAALSVLSVLSAIKRTRAPHRVPQPPRTRGMRALAPRPDHMQRRVARDAHVHQARGCCAPRAAVAAIWRILRETPPELARRRLFRLSARHPRASTRSLLGSTRTVTRAPNSRVDYGCGCGGPGAVVWAFWGPFDKKFRSTAIFWPPTFSSITLFSDQPSHP